MDSNFYSSSDQSFNHLPTGAAPVRSPRPVWLAGAGAGAGAAGAKTDSDQINPLQFIYCKKLSVNQWWWTVITAVFISFLVSCSEWSDIDVWEDQGLAVVRWGHSKVAREMGEMGRDKERYGDNILWTDITTTTTTTTATIDINIPSPPVCRSWLPLCSLIPIYRPISPLNHWKQQGAPQPTVCQSSQSQPAGCGTYK